MDTHRRRGLCNLYMMVKLLLLVAATVKVTITSDEEIYALCKDFSAIILYSLALLITFICSHLSFDMSLEIYLLNTLQRSRICSRYLPQLPVRQLYGFPFPELPHWIQFFKEVPYDLIMVRGANVLNCISIQNKWLENYIQYFVILAIVIVVTVSLESNGQYIGTLRRLFASVIIFTFCTEVSISYYMLFWSSVFCSIFTAVHISVNKFKAYVLCCTNNGIAGTTQHIVEGNRTKKTSKRSLKKERGDVSLQKGMVNELLKRANVSDADEREYMDKESFKRKRNIFETGHESLKKIIRGPTIKKCKTKSLRLKNSDKINFESMCCKQKKQSKNLGFPFGHCVHSRLNLTFSLGSTDSNANEDLNKQVEQATNWVLIPVDVIEKSDLKRDLVFHEETEILDQQIINEIGNISNVSDLVQFYESSHKESQIECLVKHDASDDKSLCTYSADFAMSEKVEHESVQQVDTPSYDAIEKNLQNSKHLSYAYVKTDFIKMENEESKTYFCGNEETSLLEAKTDFDLNQIAETDFESDNLNFKIHNLSTDNVVNEIDSRFIYSVY